MELDAFPDWLRENTNLSESTVQIYDRVLRHYVRTQGEDFSKASLNAFIAENFREKRNYHYKYALQHVLEFVGKPELQDQLVSVKRKPRKKIRHYYPMHVLRTLIQAIEKEKYRDMAELQFATGKRAHEIIKMREEMIDLDHTPTRIEFDTKGGKVHVSYLDETHTKLLKKHMSGLPGFIWLKKNYAQLSEEDLHRKVNTERTYYYRALRKAAHSIGLENFGTHDWRRNVAKLMRERTKDPYVVQHALGHKKLETTLGYFEDDPSGVKESVIGHQEEM